MSANILYTGEYINVIKPSFKILTDIDYEDVLRKIEIIGRNSHKSENRITNLSSSDFVRMIIDWGHESVIEHVAISVRIICDRGVSHEVVRHRHASYTQESTRYCNYSKNKFGNKITLISPFFWENEQEIHKYNLWLSACEASAKSYFNLLEMGATPEEARSVLPNSLKTDIIVTMNLRAWRHFFKMRANKKSHPQMRQIAVPLLKTFKNKLPVVFQDIKEE